MGGKTINPEPRNTFDIHNDKNIWRREMDEVMGSRWGDPVVRRWGEPPFEGSLATEDRRANIRRMGGWVQVEERRFKAKGHSK